MSFLRRWRSGQSHQTVNLTPSGYAGSNPALRTASLKLRSARHAHKKPRRTRPRLISVGVLSSRSSALHSFSDGGQRSQVSRPGGSCIFDERTNSGGDSNLIRRPALRNMKTRHERCFSGGGRGSWLFQPFSHARSRRFHAYTTLLSSRRTRQKPDPSLERTTPCFP